jgi:hypothetical protein
MINRFALAIVGNKWRGMIAIWRQPSRLRIPPRSAPRSMRGAREIRHKSERVQRGSHNRNVRPLQPSRRGEWCCLARPKSTPPARKIAIRLRSSRPRDRLPNNCATCASGLHHVAQQSLFFRFRQHNPQSHLKIQCLQSLIGAAISGGAARRDCSDACRAMRCQRSTRFAEAAARCESVRRAITGTIRETPSSVHFSIAHSMRSNLNTARTRVISA